MLHGRIVEICQARADVITISRCELLRGHDHISPWVRYEVAGAYRVQRVEYKTNEHRCNCFPALTDSVMSVKRKAE